MPTSGNNIIFFGTEAFSVTALAALVDNGYPVAFVVTKPDRTGGRGLQLREPAVKTYAREHAIPVLQPERLADIEPDIAAIANRMGVLSSYGKIIPQSTLDLFSGGIINIHPSLLPKYRGPTPIETAIINSDTQTGVSLIRLVAAMDAGPVYAHVTVPLDATTRADSLSSHCAQIGANLLLESLPAITSGRLQPTEQDDSQATYTQLLTKNDAEVDPDRQTADQIERHVRAYEGYPRTRLHLHGHDVIITNVHVARPGTGELGIQCARDSWLTIDQLVAPSGRTVSGADFIRGYMQ